MVFGRHKQELITLRDENQKLKEQLSQIKKQAPQINEVLKFLGDIQALAGIIEVRRIHPDSVVLVHP